MDAYERTYLVCGKRDGEFVGGDPNSLSPVAKDDREAIGDKSSRNRGISLYPRIKTKSILWDSSGSRRTSRIYARLCATPSGWERRVLGKRSSRFALARLQLRPLRSIAFSTAGIPIHVRDTILVGITMNALPLVLFSTVTIGVRST